MLNCQESQVGWIRDHDGIDFPDMIKTCSRYGGYQCDAAYAEGFRNAIKKVHENQLLFVYVQGGIYGGKRVYRKRKKRLSVMRRYKT